MAREHGVASVSLSVRGAERTSPSSGPILSQRNIDPCSSWTCVVGQSTGQAGQTRRQRWTWMLNGQTLVIPGESLVSFAGPDDSPRAADNH